jgi:hypothetical protein
MSIPAKTAEQRKAEYEAWRSGQQKDLNRLNRPQPKKGNQ